MDIIQQEADKLYKLQFGKMVAMLLSFSSDIDPQTAEDLVHDAFSEALYKWKKGIPENPAAWLYTVCKNKALNKIRKDKRIQPLSDEISGSVEIRMNESRVDDLTLRWLFTCAHPDLSPKTQVVITLKYVFNLRVDSIAAVLATSSDAMEKLLFRARQKIKESSMLLAEPSPTALKARLPIVHKIIYLTFNEGYKSSGGAYLLREELCGEALILCRAIIESGLGNNETLSLYALMLFNSARLKSRFATSGELLDLENQDRSLWDPDLISLAHHYFVRSQREPVTSYHLEAAIASLHCFAKSFQETDWKTIAGIYARLLRMYANPFVELNYAIALFYAGEKEKALHILHELNSHPFLKRYYLLNMALGKFYNVEGDRVSSKKYLLIAWAQTNFKEEKEFIENMIRTL